MTIAPYPTAVTPSKKVDNTVAYQNNSFVERQHSQDDITANHHHPEHHLEDYRPIFCHHTPPDISTLLIGIFSLYQQFQWEKEN